MEKTHKNILIILSIDIYQDSINKKSGSTPSELALVRNGFTARKGGLRVNSFERFKTLLANFHAEAAKEISSQREFKIIEKLISALKDILSALRLPNGRRKGGSGLPNRLRKILSGNFPLAG